MSLACLLVSFTLARQAAAEISVVKADGWEMFTNGRLSGFVSYLNGEGYPLIKTDPMTNTPIQTPIGGGLDTNNANGIPNANDPTAQPKLESMRIRSGFLANVLGVGFRRQLSETTTLTGYLELWSDIESEARKKYQPMPVDVRQGFTRVQGSWGTVTVGRMLTLFSRGAAEIDFLYGHGFAVGFPTAVESYGPAAGHIGTGALGPGFAAGIVYSTPLLAGLQLNASVFDPVLLNGGWQRTKWVRPEAELTYDATLGNVGKLHLFANGGYQKVYRNNEPDSTSAAAYGAGYGGRVEVGPVHLGVAGHVGQGLGLYYALETSEAAFDATPAHRLRKSDGYYAQLQLALRKFDFNVGAGISRLKPLPQETAVIAGAPVVLPADGAPDANGGRQSLIKYQLGMSAVIVYHVTPAFHVAVDYFRGDFRWQLGEHQVVNFVNTGVTMVW